jgi:inorganic triphosphatase YgiF
MEIEAKLRAPRERILDEIGRLRRLAGWSIRALAERELETVYLDTPRRDLMRAGVTFRVRRARAGVELTIKLAGGVSGAVHRRAEWTWRRRRMPRLQLRHLPPSLRARLEPWTGRRPLVALVGTRIRRRPLLVRRRGGGVPLAEIDLDRVRFFRPGAEHRPGGQSRLSYEVEIELLGGSERDLARLTQAVADRHGLRPARASKLARALRWSASRAAAPSRRARR